MITVKIRKNIRIQKHLSNGLKITVYRKDNTIIIKLNKHQIELLKYALELLNNE